MFSTNRLESCVSNSMFSAFSIENHQILVKMKGKTVFCDTKKSSRDNIN